MKCLINIQRFLSVLDLHILYYELALPSAMDPSPLEKGKPKYFFEDGDFCWKFGRKMIFQISEIMGLSCSK